RYFPSTPAHDRSHHRRGGTTLHPSPQTRRFFPFLTRLWLLFLLPHCRHDVWLIQPFPDKPAQTTLQSTHSPQLCHLYSLSSGSIDQAYRRNSLDSTSHSSLRDR